MEMMQDGDAPVNLTARKENIRDRLPELLALDQQIEAAKEKYVQPLQDERKKLKQNLKADSDIELTDINLLYKLWKRQEYAKLLDEEEDRDRILDNLRTMHDALTEGGMLDFIDAMEQDRAA